MRPTGVPDRGAFRGTAARPIVLAAAPKGAAADELHVPASIARAIGLSKDGPVIVSVGGRTAPAVIRIVETETTLRIASTLGGRLGLASGVRLHARYDGPANTLFLGPFVGILALRTRRGPLFGAHQPYFQALTKQGVKLSIPSFIFSPRDVDWQRERIAGYVFVPSSGGGAWRRSVFPFPDIVYDRVQTRRAEAGSGHAVFRKRLANRVTAWFNEHGFFDKWQLHSLMWANERLRPYLPETRRYTGSDDLEHILRMYPTAYVKPIAGSLGFGIMKIRRAGVGFSLAYEVEEHAVARFAPSIPALHRLVSKLTRGQPYIVQQGLPLASWHGRPFDIRILMQRTTGGDWAVTKIFARVAARGGITSNLTRGADACNIFLLLGHVYGRSHRSRLQRQLRAAGLLCAQEITAALPGLVGELGLDLGLGRNGRIWLIEANSKPFLQMTRDAGSARTLALSVRRPLQFAKHLAGYHEVPPRARAKEQTR